jgi:hypothetical protein
MTLKFQVTINNRGLTSQMTIIDTDTGRPSGDDETDIRVPLVI